MKRFAILYLDTLALVPLGGVEFIKAVEDVEMQRRPCLTLVRKDRKGREVWTVLNTRYYDKIV